MTNQAVISGTGLWTPSDSISNEELVSSYNAWAEKFNLTHQSAIENGECDAKPFSSADFIQKASGIKSRYVYAKKGILDIERMYPEIDIRSEQQISHQAEVAVIAARQAMESAGKPASEIDAVIVSCAYTQRAYPAIAIEVQAQLGIEGVGFDMLVACSAATFALHRASDMIKAGSAKAVLVINPELATPQMNFRDRDSHFIFGDVATAVVVESDETAEAGQGFRILSTKAKTVFSNNIRSNFGYLSRVTGEEPFANDMLFHQKGRQVFKEVCPMVVAHLSEHLQHSDLTIESVKRWWLHQANINMNQLIARKLIGQDPNSDKAPIILDRYGNTASAGSIIAFHLYQSDFAAGDVGALCSFGAGYSIGSLLLEKR